MKTRLFYVAVAASLWLAPAQADPFTCKISADGKSVDAMIANPFKRDASCQVNCQISTTQRGTSFQISCTKEIAPGAAEVVLCTKTVDEGKLVKMTGGSGECTNPEPAAVAKDKDDDVDVQALINDPAKLRERIRKDLPPDAQKMLDKMTKP